MDKCKRNFLVLICSCFTFLSLSFGEPCEMRKIQIQASDCLLCQNGGTSENATCSLSCSCADGFTGDRCNRLCINGTICPVLYWSFDSLNNLMVMESTEQINFDPRVAGQINSAVSTNHSRQQWIDLGIHTEACMTDPMTCGAAGGAIALWLRMVNCSVNGGVVTTIQHDRTGSHIGCTRTKLYTGTSVVTRIDMMYLVLPNGYFRVFVRKPNDWKHIVLNFIGPNDGEGIRVYEDGSLIDYDDTKYNLRRSASNGRISVGRSIARHGTYYASAQVDELMFFSQFLTEAEIRMLSQSTFPKMASRFKVKVQI